MEFEPKRPSKSKMVGTRLTEDEYKMVKKVAARYQRTIGETIRVLVLNALKSLKTPSTKK